MANLARGAFFLFLGISFTTCYAALSMRMPNGLIMTGGIWLPDKTSAWIEKRIYLEGNGLVLRGTSAGEPIKIEHHKLSVGSKLVTENWRKPNLAEPIYQKSCDGSLWYTNVKIIGEPMTKEEINEFEDSWPDYAEGRAERVEKGLRNGGKLSKDKKVGSALADQEGTLKQQKRGGRLAGLLPWFFPSMSWSF